MPHGKLYFAEEALGGTLAMFTRQERGTWEVMAGHSIRFCIMSDNKLHLLVF